MHDGMPYGRNQGQGQGHSREVDRQSPTGLILFHCCSVQVLPSIDYNNLPVCSISTSEETLLQLPQSSGQICSNLLPEIIIKFFCSSHTT